MLFHGGSQSYAYLASFLVDSLASLVKHCAVSPISLSIASQFSWSCVIIPTRTLPDSSMFALQYYVVMCWLESTCSYLPRSLISGQVYAPRCSLRPARWKGSSIYVLVRSHWSTLKLRTARAHWTQITLEGMAVSAGKSWLFLKSFWCLSASAYEYMICSCNAHSSTASLTNFARSKRPSGWEDVQLTYEFQVSVCELPSSALCIYQLGLRALLYAVHHPQH